MRGLTTLHYLSVSVLNPFLCLGEGGEAGRLGAGGSGLGAVSPRSGAGPPPRPVAVSAAESSQSPADLNCDSACCTDTKTPPSSAWRPGFHSRAKQSEITLITTCR